jgi:hypothetical protein
MSEEVAQLVCRKSERTAPGKNIVRRNGNGNTNTLSTYYAARREILEMIPSTRLLLTHASGNAYYGWVPPPGSPK